ncbi:hypothetical protein Nepgr_006126 [Nepenthes gracilis]|uniref:AAA+ ATPase domain-containing protein n=1 Tax=Nepenthes gracilis TaxID=150966 RepID=A0AAD3XH30_NEPGR|nr:hypothetical protein Nepgr_006126 [Nepenthes gracilis]
MAYVSVAYSNGVIAAPHRIHLIKVDSFDKNGGLSSFSSPRYFSASFPSLRSQIYGNLWHGMVCSAKIRSLTDGDRENKHTHLQKKEYTDVRRRFLIGLQHRLRLLCIELKRASTRISNDFRMFLKNNMKRVALTASISISLGICYLLLKLMALPSPTLVPYSNLVTSLQSGSVTKVLFEEGSRRIHFNTRCQGVETAQVEEEDLSSENAPNVNVATEIAKEDSLKAAKANGISVIRRIVGSRASTPQWQYSTRKIDHDESFLLSLMREKGTAYSSAPQSILMSIRSFLITILALWIPLTPLMWLLYRQLYAANRPAKKRNPANKMVSFDDVEGVDTAKVELMEIVLCLQGAIEYKKLGARLPRGVLLVGAPGTGKTLLARAVAGEAGVPFFSVSASEFVELFVGRGAARIRDLFNVARKCAPSIIFIDELDAVGGKRGRSFNDERDQTLNQLLTELDGFESDTKVVVIAATNRPEALDPALCRPGRFSRKVVVGEPDEVGRRKILAVHLRGVPLEEDQQLICSLVASLTPGFVGADLANIVNEAALLAARRAGESVSREDIMEAIERAKFGISDRQQNVNRLSKELGKLFPWMPSLMGRNETRSEGIQEPLGYQTLS